MKTLLKENNCTVRWYPESIQNYKSNLLLKGNSNVKTLVKSNFAYNIQYIEYLEKQLSEMNLSSVLITMLYKTYIITAMGIIEALFVHLLKAKNEWKKTDRKLLLTTISNQKSHKGKILKTETMGKKIKQDSSHVLVK